MISRFIAGRKAMGYNGFLQFKNQFDAQQINLQSNYRNAPDILKHALLLIENNRARVKKRLVPMSRVGSDIRIGAFRDTEQEIEWIIEDIKANRDGSYAVLARTNRMLMELGAALLDAKIPLRKERHGLMGGARRFSDVKHAGFNSYGQTTAVNNRHEHRWYASRN